MQCSVVYLLAATGIGVKLQAICFINLPAVIFVCSFFTSQGIKEVGSSSGIVAPIPF